MSTPRPTRIRLWDQRDFRIGLTFLLAFWAFLAVTEWSAAVAHLNHLVIWLQLTALGPGSAAATCARASARYLIRGWRQSRPVAETAAPSA